MTVLAGWDVSGRRAAGALTLTDCTPLAKILLRAPASGQAAAELAVPFGRARRNEAGVLVVGSGPGEGLLIAPPGQAADVGARPDGLPRRGPSGAADLRHPTHRAAPRP